MDIINLEYARSIYNKMQKEQKKTFSMWFDISREKIWNNIDEIKLSFPKVIHNSGKKLLFHLPDQLTLDTVIHFPTKLIYIKSIKLAN